MQLVEGLYIPDDDHPEHHIAQSVKDHDSALHKEILQRATNFRHMVDVGGNVGRWAIKYASHFDTVTAFEPAHYNIECFKKNCGNLQNVNLFEYGLSDKNTSGVLDVKVPNHLGSTMVVERYKGDILGDIKLRPMDEMQFTHVDVLKIDKANIEFKNTSFSYPKTNEAAIKNVNFLLNGGSTAAVVGHSGAGKSTIMNLIPRFYDPSEGKIYIDGQNITEITLSSLRQNISLVSQDIILFDDTIRANIAYANLAASNEEIKKACDFAAATDFIEKLPQSYETLIGENGIRLSGGQKQRISIARAILKDAPIILLDEATSSLDSESEEKVQNAIMNLTKNKTTLVIAHRLSTIIRAEKIIVLKEGKIVETGTHTELLNNSKIYKNLYSIQLSSN